MTPESPRQLPFLKRNIARAVNVLNGAFGSPVLVRQDSNLRVTGNGERPRKRRRLSTPDDVDKLIVPPKSSDLAPMLRIEVLRCHHMNSKKTNLGSGPIIVSPDATTRANCRITISDVTSGHPRVLHCESQACTMVTFKNSTGPYRVARVELSRPFYVPRDSLLVDKLDDAANDLADAYRLSIEIASPNGTSWPPLDRRDLEHLPQWLLDTSTRHWVFSSSFDDLFGRLKAPLILTARAGLAESSTDYEMDVDLQWTSGHMTMKRLEYGSRHSMNGVGPNEAKMNGHVEEMLDDCHDMDGVTNGELTPSRSLRTRGGEKTYNLKALSDKAHGRKRKPRKPNQSLQVGEGEGRVKYFLPPDQPVSLDGFRCVSCGIFHQSLQHLQLHLQNTHPDYDFKLTETTSQGPQFQVTRHLDPPTTPSKTFGIKPALKTFNLGTFITGDDAWRSARLDPDTKDDFVTSREAKIDFARIAAKSPRKRPSRPTVATKVVSPRRKIIIPETPHTFYHPVSKQVLKTGQEVPDPVVETQWFHHKHRQSLNDIDNVTPAELEYMKEFDDIMRKHDISARAYFPRAWLDFVEQKAGWLIEAKHRMVEFSVHESYLLVSDLIQDEHVQEAMEHIESERTKRRKLQRTSPDEEESGASTGRLGPEPSSKTPPIRKSASGCGKCGLPVLPGPQGLVCSNKTFIPLFMRAPGTSYPECQVCVVVRPM
ncbi:hypothetical protein ACO1O0_002449 [Amphichorda felina]